MKNKRKIWVRLGAFMAALICCVLCVVPAYAEAAETAEEDLAVTIAEQQEKLNRMLRPTGYEIDYDVYLYSVGKTYADIRLVGEIDSDFPTYAYNEVLVRNNYINCPYVAWIDVFDASNVRVVNMQVSVTQVDMGYRVATGSSNITFNFQYNSGYNAFVVSFDPTGEWTQIKLSESGGNEAVYAVADGYRFYVNYISVDDRIDPRTSIACSRNWSCSPSMLLALNSAGDTDEAYNEGYTDGYDEGYSTGSDSGYRTGYDDGMNQTSLIDGIKSLFRAPMEFIESVLDFEVFGIDLGDAVKALVSMMLLALVVTIVWKAVK